jgi:hypothetical protein
VFTSVDLLQATNILIKTNNGKKENLSALNMVSKSLMVKCCLIGLHLIIGLWKNAFAD